ncbi:MAG: RluA family pseudouridine synthase [Sulfurospirillum sp.]|nr:RluA family pseudouridine synthase [Sulfurospirillum sp.]
MDEFGISIHEAQRIVDRKRVFLDGIQVSDKAAFLCGEISVVVFEPEPSGLLPIFETPDFAIFDKPSGLLVHPRKRESVQTLNDDIKALFGVHANAAHRIDKETSGLVLVGKDKANEIALKALFEEKKVSKEYFALVRGCFEDSMLIDARLIVGHPTCSIKIKVHVDENGKESLTKIEPISYWEKYGATLVKAIPFTGRQHQIRAHLFHVKHPIVGDPIYGIDEKFTDLYLDKLLDDPTRKKLTHSLRLLLHAYRITFVYRGISYDIVSKMDFESEFLQALE